MLWLTLDQDRVVHDAQGQARVALPLLASTHWNTAADAGFPPTASQLEQAIAVIEDLLMPQLPLPGAPAPGLHARSAAPDALREPAGLAPCGRQWLARESLEALFNRLADAANGTPLRSLGLPDDPVLAAHVVGLRELLHHADLAGLWLEA